MTYISPRASIATRVYIGTGVVVLGSCHIESETIIEDNCIVGKPSRDQLAGLRENLIRTHRPVTDYAVYDSLVDTETVIGKGVQLQRGAVVYSGVTMGEGVICEDDCIVRWDTVIGAHSKIMFGALVSSYASIGEYCRIGGFCCNDAYIGNYTSMFGSLVHAYTKYGGGRRDPAPKLKDRVTVGWGAQIIGGVTVHEDSYVAAGSTVTKDVPSRVVATSTNVHNPLPKWLGDLRGEYLDSFPQKS